MTALRSYVVSLLAGALLSACIPTTSTSFFIGQRPDPLSDVQGLEQLCRELGMSRIEAVGPPQPPTGTFVCQSVPTRGYFIVFTPETEKKQIHIYFAERADYFSPEAKMVYSNLVSGLQKRFGEAAASAPTI